MLSPTTIIPIWVSIRLSLPRCLTKSTNRIRNREHEVLFMDLRQIGIPFEKKYIELDAETRDAVIRTYHSWQQEKESKQKLKDLLDKLGYSH